MKILIFLSVTFLSFGLIAQDKFTTNPSQAKFITYDIPNFWRAFDNLGKEKNPFIEYLKNGSQGLSDFIENRIENPKNLLKTVENRSEDYQAIRSNSSKIESYWQPVKQSFYSFKDWYPAAVFPPTYFVVGAFNSGGTSSKNGLIIGVELQENVENIPHIVAHEMVHFNQNYPLKRTTLLEQSIREGAADFIGELISGKHTNERAFEYGIENEKLLCGEFITIMDDFKYHGWLYGSDGKKKERPNDLGYWMGYKICESYFNKSADKKKAIYDILNILDFSEFLDKSEYLSTYIKK